MNCDLEIHNEFKSMGEICCPFCDKKLQDCSVKQDLCCGIPDIINNNGMNVCRSCGVAAGFFCGSRVTGHGLQVTGQGSRVTGHWSGVTGHRSRVTSHMQFY